MKVSPSILSADFSNLKDEIKAVEKAGADFIHLDVMDGHFVPNITIGPVVIKSLRKVTNLTFDTHLMIEKPDKYIEDFIKAGSDYVTIHIEASTDIKRDLQMIKNLGAKCGISIKPNTSVKDIKHLLQDLDLILVMSVEPGFGGQKFMDNSLDKIKLLDTLRKENNFNYLIEVDGGVNEETALLCKKAGCDYLVAGSYIFNNDDYEQQIRKLKEV